VINATTSVFIRPKEKYRRRGCLADRRGHAPPPRSQEAEAAKANQRHRPGRRLWNRNRADQALRLAVEAVGEKEGVWVSVGACAAERQRPEAAR